MRNWTLSAGIGLLVVAGGCGTQNPLGPGALPNAGSALGSEGQLRYDVCHVDGTGRIVRITIADPALDAHIAHGDGRPGLLVMPAQAQFTASNTWTDNPPWQDYMSYQPVPALAFDGDANTMWNSGILGPPYLPTARWIEVDFGLPQMFSEVSAVVSQTPPGNTTHVVTFDDAPAFSWSGYTSDGQVLTENLGTAVRVQRVRITTTYSPSWVSWFEIQFTLSGC